MVVSRGAPLPVCFWPMRVTLSQSLIMVSESLINVIGEKCSVGCGNGSGNGSSSGVVLEWW